jgi:phosphomannomutase
VAVTLESADGGLILTASHNPKQWNALKLLNEKGEFLNSIEGQKILELAESDTIEFSEVDDLGVYSKNRGYVQKHIEEVLNLELVDIAAIKKANFRVVLDAVNSTGGIFIPALLQALGVECVKLYCEPNGDFPHNPEPLKEHLGEISKLVVKEKADFGIVVDPDVDRLALVCEDGSMFGEEYTLVACADYVLSKKGGNTVSNLSSSRALRDVTQKYGGQYTASAVGEVNVVQLMKDTHAIIGGEGNGGIIYPDSHYGRDSLVGVALFLSHMAKGNLSCKELRESYPSYFMSKNKIQLTPRIDVDTILELMAEKYQNEDISTIDGVKVDFDTEWVHLRKSNTEPIIRIYTESTSQENADNLAQRIISEIREIIK